MSDAPALRARPTPPIASNDCSDGAQAWRKLKLAELLDKLYSGVDSLGDRGRSVNYYSPGDLEGLIRKLRIEDALCDGTLTPEQLRRLRGRSISYLPYDKWE